jgi:hypothetical protein
MEKIQTEAGDQIKRAELQESVKQALVRLLDDPQVKKKILALLRDELRPWLWVRINKSIYPELALAGAGYDVEHAAWELASLGLKPLVGGGGDHPGTALSFKRSDPSPHATTFVSRGLSFCVIKASFFSAKIVK